MLTLYLIRHAESEGNLKPQFIGGRSNHLNLSERGEKQAIALGKRLLNEHIVFDKVYSSNAVRAYRTAELACEQISFPLQNIIGSDSLLELDQGEWVGKLRNEMYSPENLKIINADRWNFKAPQGESQREVEIRMMNFLQDNIIRNWNSQPSTIAIFSHGMAIKCLIRGLLQSDTSLTHRFIINNTSISVFRLDEKGWHFERMNDTSHLQPIGYIDSSYNNLYRKPE